MKSLPSQLASKVIIFVLAIFGFVVLYMLYDYFARLDSGHARQLPQMVANVTDMRVAARALKRAGPAPTPEPGYIPEPILIDTTSDEIQKDAARSTVPIFVLYYRSQDVDSALQEMRVRDAGRYWRDSVRFYKVDVDRDSDPGSRVRTVPTMVLMQPDKKGNLVLLNVAVGWHDYTETYDFFVDGLSRQKVMPRQNSLVKRVTAADIDICVQKGKRPAVVLYYNSDSLLSQLAVQVFENVSVIYKSDFSFLKIDVTQDDQDSSRFGGVPIVAVYTTNGFGDLMESAVLSGFCHEMELGQFLSLQIEGRGIR